MFGNQDLFDNRVIKVNASLVALCTMTLIALMLLFFDGISHMFRVWMIKEEYSHGFFLPLIAIYILWQRRNFLAQLPNTGSYLGFFVVCFGMALGAVGELGTLYTVIQYGFVVAIFGVILSITGVSSFRHYFFPLLILVFMIPFPSFLYNSLSSKLQLISSEIGVAVIQLFNIPVYLEGNVIDLGKMKLQVVEACSGLRYLFPLSALAYVLALMFQANTYFKVLVFLSSVPVTIIMNSFRIGLIGVTVDIWGKKAAEGLLHDFEGWVVFMSSLAVLILEIIVLARITGDKRALGDLLQIQATNVNPSTSFAAQDGASKKGLRPFYLSIAAILLLSGVLFLSPERDENIPERISFSAYPEQLGIWSGQRDYLNPDHLKSLKLTDYLLMNYSSQLGAPVNYYVAYYDSQQKGRSAHSPKSCIPGDGWEMSGFKSFDLAITDEFSLPVNRTLIKKGTQTSLIYYWFQQRGRVLNNEYLVKFYILWDSLTLGRTDGAMIRVTTPVFANEPVAQAEERIQTLIRESQSSLQNYVPG
ncbi:MAG: VPLPA-CTERM-specific exosortase XrtD [Pseudomonadales bacterium]|nr:VPLPA-CTERM-specific exosortase XrtD [Pseudomonadales bacterium]